MFGRGSSILSHNEMCRREGVSLQRGMNFGLGGHHSVILMSVRPNSPYRDRLEEDGTILVYEGHDHPKNANCPNPKVVDQPEQLPSGKLTQNGKFHRAAQEHKAGQRAPEHVRVYEKIKSGIWSYNGKCRLCEASDELHFDHIVPFSRGGTSLTAENVQLLCARHNLQKRDRIE